MMYRFKDSYSHYRHQVGCKRIESIWRTFAYEILNWPDGIRSKGAQ